MVEKVNGHFVPGETLSSDNEFFEIRTSVNILVHSGSTGSDTTQKALDKLVEVISLRGQPVIAGSPYLDSEDSKYVFKFTTEHAGSWDATPTLLESIVEHAGSHGFAANNTTVSSSDLI